MDSQTALSGETDRARPVPPFGEAEKRYFLGEIFKTSQLGSTQMMRIIWDLKIDPDWNHMALPHGRSLADCKCEFENLFGGVLNQLQEEQARKAAVKSARKAGSYVGGTPTHQPALTETTFVHENGGSSKSPGPKQQQRQQHQQQLQPNSQQQQQHSQQNQSQQQQQPPPSQYHQQLQSGSSQNKNGQHGAVGVIKRGRGRPRKIRPPQQEGETSVIANMYHDFISGRSTLSGGNSAQQNSASGHGSFTADRQTNREAPSGSYDSANMANTGQAHGDSNKAQRPAASPQMIDSQLTRAVIPDTQMNFGDTGNTGIETGHT